jgi:transcriptional regulator with GAF, ATPase, and Fis domain
MCGNYKTSLSGLLFARIMESFRIRCLHTKKGDAPTSTVSNGTFMDSQRALILQALDATGWTIGGPLGAAARLGLKRSTLVSKMKKLGIYRPRRQRFMDEFKDESERASRYLHSS